MIKKRIIFGWIGLFILYFFLFAAPLGKEQYLYLKNSIDLSQTAAFNDGEGENHAFSITPYFGHLDKNFKLTSLLKSDQKVTYNDQYYLFYDNDTLEHPLYDSKGLKVASIEANAVPFVYDKSVYMVNSESGIITRYNSSGRLLWSYDVGSFITSISFSDHTLIVGLLNGFMQFITTDGLFESEYRAGGSRVDIIYGVAISRSGRYAAAVTGLDPQRFILLERGIYGYVPLHFSALSSALRRSVHVAFSNDEAFVSYEEDGFYHTYDITRKISNFIPIEGTIRMVKQDIFAGFQAVHSSRADRHYLKIISYVNSYPLLIDQYNARVTSLSRIGNQIVFGFDQKLMLIERGRGYAKR